MNRNAVPMVCLVCKHQAGNYYGRLVFPDETEAPMCPNHTEKSLSYPLTPVTVPALSITGS